MNAAKNPPLPASLLRPEAEEHDLDARILQAEQRLIAREEKLRRRVNQLGSRVHEAWQPRRWVPPLAGGAAALLALLWFGRRRAAAAPAPARPASPSHGGMLAHGLSLLGLVWPLLPATWRARVPTSVVNVVMGVGLPLVETLLQRRPGRASADAGTERERP